MSLQDVVITLSNSFLIGFPYLIEAIVWLLVGLLLGKLAGWIVKQFLVRIKLDQYIVEKEKI